MHTRLNRASLAAALVSIACGTEPSRPPTRILPIIDSAEILPGPYNVLSAIVSVRVRDADSVAVRFRLEEALDGFDSLTAALPVTSEWTTVPVLGLLPGRRYILRTIAYGDGNTAVGSPLAITTGQLPDDLPSYSASGANPSPGYVAMAAGLYGLVIDNTGRVVWYHRFTNGPWLNFMAQANGRYVARLVTPDQSDVESWVELDPLGNVTRTLGCRQGLQPRFHDLIAETNGGYWILCDETRTMDLTPYGGMATARVTGTAVQHISDSGELLFQWTPFDHFEITDVDSSFRAGMNVNWTHGNSLDLDAAGNLLVSFRNLNEITSIDTHTGQVRWRFGGRRNEFALEAGSRLFAGQHSIRVLPAGDIVLLDNVGDSLESRAERWAIDPVAKSARLTASYGSVPGVRTLVGGSVQAPSSTSTLVSFGTEGRVEEYDTAGNVRWRIEGTPGYVFRAQRFPSLYRPGVGAAR